MEGNQVVKLIVTQPAPHDDGDVDNGPFFCVLLYEKSEWEITVHHSLIRVVLIQSCSAGAKNFTTYVFCHPQFSVVIQNIENCCVILTPVCL